MSVVPHQTSRSQRWRDRRDRWVPNSSVIDPRQFSVDVIDPKVARDFIASHHYLGRNIPPVRLTTGLFRNGPGGKPELCGAVAFTVPINNAAVPRHTGMAPQFGVELGRLVLLDDVAGNGESYAVSRSFRLLRATLPQIEAVITYADPAPRQAPDGTLTQKGHVGLVYAALSARSLGQQKRRRQLLLPNGQVFSDRTASKIRNNESGSAYAIRQLLDHGAPSRPPGQSPADWLTALVSQGFLRTRMHPGVHAYSWGLTKKARLAGRHLTLFPYPRRAADPDPQDVTALPLFAATAA